MPIDDYKGLAEYTAAARKAGYSDEEIESYLQTRPDLVPPSRTIAGTAGDVGIAAAKGFMGLTEAAVGLADIPTGGRAGKFMDETVGFRPNDAREVMDSYLSPAQQEANRRVEIAGEGKGLLGKFVDKSAAAVQNPSVIGSAVVESLPLMVGGARIGQGVVKGAAALTGRQGIKAAAERGLAGAVIGEGALGAGSAAEQIRQQTEDGTLSGSQVLSAIGSGLGTSAFTLIGGKVASKLGIADIDSLIASGNVTAEVAKKGFLRQLVEGGFSEGVLEELPQSVQEQLWQNYATDRPLSEGVPEAASLGMLSGAVMGGPTAGLLSKRATVQAQGGDALDQAAAGAGTFSYGQRRAPVATDSRPWNPAAEVRPEALTPEVVPPVRQQGLLSGANPLLQLPAPDSTTPIQLGGTIPMGSPNTVDLRSRTDERQTGQEPPDRRALEKRKVNMEKMGVLSEKASPKRKEEYKAIVAQIERIDQGENADGMPVLQENRSETQSTLSVMREQGADQQERGATEVTGTLSEQGMASQGDLAKQPYEMTLAEFKQHKLETNRYRASYEADPEALQEYLDGQEEKWLATLKKRAAEGRIPDEVIDDAVTKYGMGVMREFRGSLDKGVAGYQPKEIRDEVVAPERQRLAMEKQPWERTWDEQRKEEFSGMTRRASPKEYADARKVWAGKVQAAIYDGKNVPDSIKAEAGISPKTDAVPTPPSTPPLATGGVIEKQPWDKFEPNAQGYQARDVDGLDKRFFVAQQSDSRFDVIESERGSTRAIVTKKKDGWKINLEGTTQKAGDSFLSHFPTDAVYPTPQEAVLSFNKAIAAWEAPESVTLAEYKQQGGTESTHRTAVINAVNHKKDIPAAVLADYPDLKPSSSPPSPNAGEGKGTTPFISPASNGLKNTPAHTETVEVAGHKRDRLTAMRDEISQGEAGKRMPVTADMREWTGISSTFPDYFKDKGLTKKETLAIIDRALAPGAKLTTKQAATIKDLTTGRNAIALDQLLKKRKDRQAQRRAEADFFMVDETAKADNIELAKELYANLSDEEAVALLNGDIFGQDTVEAIESLENDYADTESFDGQTEEVAGSGSEGSAEPSGEMPRQEVAVEKIATGELQENFAPAKTAPSFTRKSGTKGDGVTSLDFNLEAGLFDEPGNGVKAEPAAKESLPDMGSVHLDFGIMGEYDASPSNRAPVPEGGKLIAAEVFKNSLTISKKFAARYGFPEGKLFAFRNSIVENPDGTRYGQTEYMGDNRRTATGISGDFKLIPDIVMETREFDALSNRVRKLWERNKPTTQGDMFATAATPETGYFKGDKVEFTDEPAPEGFRSFVYLEGNNKGQSGVKRTDEAKADDVAKDQNDWKDQQEAFSRIRKAENVLTEDRASVRDGDIFTDKDGNEFMFKGMRYGAAEMFPIINGKPEVYAGSSITWSVGDMAKERNPERRSDPLTVTGRNYFDETRSPTPPPESAKTPEEKKNDPTTILKTLEESWPSQEERYDRIEEDGFDDFWKRRPSKQAVKKYIVERYAEGNTGGTVTDIAAELAQMTAKDYAKYDNSPEVSPQEAKKEGKKEGIEIKTPADRDDFHKKLNGGELTIDEFKAAFASLLANKDAIIADINKLTKPQIFEKFPGLQWRWKNETKGEVVDALYRAFLGDFNLGDTISYGMGKNSYENALQAKVDTVSQQDLDQYASDYKKNVEERIQKIAALKETVKDPKTLEDFNNYIRLKKNEGMTFTDARLTLSPEQRATYDILVGEKTRNERKETKEERQGAIGVAGQTVEGQIIETKHTQKGHDLFVVQLAERVSKEDYTTLNAAAKKMGGYYSSFRGRGAVPGFQFTERAQAEAFVSLAGGDKTAAQETVQERRNAFADDRTQTAAARLTEMADALDDKAEAVMTADRKTNTNKRAAQAASAEAHARKDQALAQTMRNIAGAIESGKAQFLDRVRQKVQVELLNETVRSAKWIETKAKYEGYAEQQKHEGEPAAIETADFADWPQYVLYRSDLATLARKLLDLDGTKLIGQKILKEADDVTDAYLAFAKENLHLVSTFSKKDGGLAAFPSRLAAESSIAASGYKGKAISFQVKRNEHLIIMSPTFAVERGVWQGDNDKRITLNNELGAEIVEKLQRKGGNKVTVPWQLERTKYRRDVLKRMGIETPAEFRAALREFIGLQEAPKEADKIKAMERAMVGRKKDGLDFFPTPETTADEMVEAAGIEEGMTVLEPSAGMGHIADRIRETGVEPDVVEMSGDRRELLEAKGFNVVGRDFLDVTGEVGQPDAATLAEMKSIKKDIDDLTAKLEKQHFLATSRAQATTRNARSGQSAEMRDEKKRQLRGMIRQAYQAGQTVPAEIAEAVDADYNDQGNYAPIQRPEGKRYDRIIMNPPFSDRRDAQHVQHAYSLLKPNGRIVAIMGEGVFFGNDKKAQAFRDWLDSLDATVEKLPEGTFNDPSLPVNTSVNARLVVIDKKADSGITFSSSTSTKGTALPLITGIAKRVKLADGWKVVAIQSTDQLPAEVQEEMQRQGITQVEGVKNSHDKTIYLVADGLSSMNRAKQVVAHETFHVGIIEAELLAYKNSLPQSKLDAFRRQNPAYAKADDLTIANEMLAQEAETNLWVKRIIGKVNDWLKSIGIDLKISKADVYSMIDRALTNATQGGTVGSGTTEFSGLGRTLKNMADDLKGNPFAKDVQPIELSGGFNDNGRNTTGVQQGTPRGHAERQLFEAISYGNTAVNLGEAAHEVARRITAKELSRDEALQAFAKAVNSVAITTPDGMFILRDIRNHLKELGHDIPNSGKEAMTGLFKGIGDAWQKSQVQDGEINFSAPKYTVKNMQDVPSGKGVFESGKDYIDRLVSESPKFKDNIERFVYAWLNTNDPRKRVYADADKKTVRNNMVTVEELRGKKTAAEVAAFRESTVEPMLKELAEAKLAVSDLEEYGHALHAPERNQRMREVNAKRILDQLTQRMTDSEAAPWQEKIDALRGDKTLTDKEMQQGYLDLMDEIFADIDKREKEVERRQEILDNRKWTQEEIDKGTPERAQKLVDNAIRNIEATRALEEKWLDESPRYSGMTDEEADSIVDKWEKDPRRKALKSAKAKLDAINRAGLDALHESGELSDAEYDGILNGYQHYVPLMREGFTDARPTTGRITGPTGKPLKVAMGSMREVVNIVAHSVQNYQTAVNRKHKAAAGKALFEFALDNPNSGITVEKVAKKPTHDKEGNIVLYPDMMEPDNGVFVKIDGERHLLLFDTDERTAKGRTLARFLDSIKGDSMQLGPLMNALTRVNRYLAMVNTMLSPEFMLSNFVRDFQTSMIHLSDEKIRPDKGFRKKVSKDIFPAIAGIYRSEAGKDGGEMGKWYKEFAKEGGKIGWLQGYEKIDDLAKELEHSMKLYGEGHVTLKSLEAMKKLVSQSNTSVENGVRLATYKNLVESGVPKQKAASIASKLTVDFTQKGKYGPALNSLYLFANAGIQGNVRMITALGTSKKVQKIVGGLVVGGFALQLMALAGGDDDTGEPYVLGLPDFVRERNIIFMLPGTEGKYISVPMPYGYNVFNNIGAEAANLLYMGTKGKDYDASQGAMRIATTFANSFNPLSSGTILQTLSPTIADPIVMAAENKDYTGRDLMPEQSQFDAPKPDSEMYWKGVSPTSKYVAAIVNNLTGGDRYESGLVDVSPETLDMMYDTATGSTGKFVANILNLPQRVMSGELEPNRMPFSRRFFGQWDDKAISERYHAAVEKGEIAKQRLDGAETPEEKERVRNSAEFQNFRLSKGYDKQIAVLRKNLKFAEAKNDKERVARIRKQITDAQKKYLSRVNSLQSTEN